MRARWAFWAVVLFVIGVTMGKYWDFLDTLAMDRSILLGAGLAVLLIVPLLVAISLDERDRGKS